MPHLPDAKAHPSISDGSGMLGVSSNLAHISDTAQPEALTGGVRGVTAGGQAAHRVI